MVDGELKAGDTIRLINTAKEYQVDEVGVLSPKQIAVCLLPRLRTSAMHSSSPPHLTPLPAELLSC